MNCQETLSWVSKDNSGIPKQISDRFGKRTSKKWHNILQRQMKRFQLYLRSSHKKQIRRKLIIFGST